MFSQLQITVTPPNGGTAKSIDIGDITVKAGESITAATAAAINGKLGETGVMAKIESGKIQLVSVKDGQTFALGNAGAPSKSTTPVPTPVTDFTEIGLIKPQVAPEAPSAPAQSPASSSDINITTAEGAQQALSIVDKSLESVNSVRADLGAIQNRFTSVVANLQTSSENLSASRSRIRDTDFAKETAELTGPRSCSRPAPQCWPRPTRSLRTCSACCSADIRRS